MRTKLFVLLIICTSLTGISVLGQTNEVKISVGWAEKIPRVRVFSLFSPRHFPVADNSEEWDKILKPFFGKRFGGVEAAVLDQELFILLQDRDWDRVVEKALEDAIQNYFESKVIVQFYGSGYPEDKILSAFPTLKPRKKQEAIPGYILRSRQPQYEVHSAPRKSVGDSRKKLKNVRKIKKPHRDR